MQHREIVEIDSRIVADRDAEPVPLVGDEMTRLLARAAFLAPDEAQRERACRASASPRP